MCKTVTCVNCGETKPHGGHGMCKNCYRYWHTHRTMRPVDSNERRRRRKILHCINCGALREGTHAKRGMCSKCYAYWRWSGVMRPAHISRRANGAPPPLCANCRQNIVQHGKLCKLCANYKYQHGKRRPPRLWADSCTNCGKPHNGSHPRSGMCIRCRRYQNKSGRPRPAHLWGKGKLGWCDCGNPATHMISVKIHRHTDTIPVCDACYEEEMRQRRIYGDIDQPPKGVLSTPFPVK